MKNKFLLIFFNVLIISTLQAQTIKKLIWEFPITRPHAGILLGNGTQGLMVWGAENKLDITIGRAGFWDHRGGNDFATRTTYQDVKKMLEANDEKALRAAFEIPKKEGKPNFGHPQQMGGGRLEITLPQGWKITKGELNLEKAEILIIAQNLGKVQNIIIRQSPFDEVASVNLGAGLIASKVKLISAYEFNREALTKVGIEKPFSWVSTDGNSGGFVQNMPSDLPLAIGFLKQNQSVVIVSSLRFDAREIVEKTLKNTKNQFISQESDAWWKSYWESVPKVNVPDPVLQEIYDYGLYKQGCSTPSQGVACALQGPFMEDYQIVPWSNDYHFNINEEMIYYPALMSGRFDHFKPLWKMIDSWKSEISQNGESFFGRKGAMMLPHAVDDKCKVVGTFWTGTIDQACTAWMAQLAWLHYRYSGDKTVLENTAYPLLVGAFEGYFAMLQEEDDGKGGKRYSLPISVSPEYRGSNIDAWGKNASFQLAALHSVCKNIQKAATILGKPFDYRWDDVDKRLPEYTTFEGEFQQEWHQKNKRIALWEGMDLVESHRHHSHLASIYPFVTIEPASEVHHEIVANSLTAWRYRGAGGWSGWCVPWASILLARTGQTEAAVNWLHYWKDNFTNEGRGTLHNANSNGNSIISAPIWAKQLDKPVKEIMQLDAGFGALTAVYELLIQNRLDGIYVLPDLSINWKNLEFQDVWAEGGFKISAKVQEGKITEIKIKCTQNTNLRLFHNLGEKFSINGVPREGKMLEKQCKVGEEIILKGRN